MQCEHVGWIKLQVPVVTFGKHNNELFSFFFFFLRIRTVHLDIIKVLFIHQLMH